MNTGHIWTPDEISALVKAYHERPYEASIQEFARDYSRKCGLSVPSIRNKVQDLLREGKINKVVTASPYPIYNDPLVMEGDALVLPDVEFPFHNADFLNKCLDLAASWGVRQLILAGDVMHFDSLSGWEPNWKKENKGGITAAAEVELLDAIEELPEKYRSELESKIRDIGVRTEEDGASTEIEIAARELKKIVALFDRVDFVLGNHEGRLLRALGTALDPKELIKLLEGGNKWRIAPYYFSYLDTDKGRYQIEHPKGAGEGTAQGLAAKFHNHIIMGHSHLLDFSWDISGQYYAIHAGHCVDEKRLPYAAQRHTNARTHKPGAVIVLDGYPWLLHDGTDWERMKQIK